MDALAFYNAYQWLEPMEKNGFQTSMYPKATLEHEPLFVAAHTAAIGTLLADGFNYDATLHYQLNGWQPQVIPFSC